MCIDGWTKLIKDFRIFRQENLHKKSFYLFRKIMKNFPKFNYKLSETKLNLLAESRILLMEHTPPPLLFILVLLVFMMILG